MLNLIINSILSGYIIFFLFNILFMKLSNNEININTKKPLGVRLSFFITGILIYLLCYYFNFD
jgi:hypothetical protein